MPHIFHITESLRFGGAEKVLVDLANQMVNDYKVTICCTKEYGELKNDLDDRIELICLNKKEGNDYKLPFVITNIIRERSVDIIHTHDWGVYLEGGIAALLGRTKGIVHTQHGPYISYAPGMLSKVKMYIRHVAEYIISYKFYKIITVSESIKKYIINDINISSNKILTIHNGIENKKGIKKNNKLHDDVAFITVGRLAAIKNHKMLLKAFKAASEERGNIKLSIIGDGDEKNKLQKYCDELSITNKVEFPGFLSNVQDYLEEADIFIMTSIYEGISIAILEAMRESLPVIGTNVGGMAEVVKNNETGYLVELNNISAMKSKMLKLIDNKNLRKEMGIKGNEYFNQEYTIEKMINKYKNIYEEILNCG